MVPAATEPGDEGLRRFRVSGQGVVTVGTADAGIFKRWRLYVCQDILKTYLTKLNVSWQRLRTGGNSTRRKDRSSDALLCGPNCQGMNELLQPAYCTAEAAEAAEAFRNLKIAGVHRRLHGASGS